MQRSADLLVERGDDSTGSGSGCDFLKTRRSSAENVVGERGNVHSHQTKKSKERQNRLLSKLPSMRYLRQSFGSFNSIKRSSMMDDVTSETCLSMHSNDEEFIVRSKTRRSASQTMTTEQTSSSIPPSQLPPLPPVLRLEDILIVSQTWNHLHLHHEHREETEPKIEDNIISSNEDSSNNDELLFMVKNAMKHNDTLLLGDEIILQLMHIDPKNARKDLGVTILQSERFTQVSLILVCIVDILVLLVQGATVGSTLSPTVGSNNSSNNSSNPQQPQGDQLPMSSLSSTSSCQDVAMLFPKELYNVARECHKEGVRSELLGRAVGKAICQRLYMMSTTTNTNETTNDWVQKQAQVCRAWRNVLDYMAYKLRIVSNNQQQPSKQEQ